MQEAVALKASRKNTTENSHMLSVGCQNDLEYLEL